jgi:hypothetical protein
MSIENDGKSFDNISATTAQFQLYGGRFGIVAHGTWGGGSATLEVLADDNTTWVVAATALTADGTALVDLPPGVYRWAVATATALYLSLIRVPL